MSIFLESVSRGFFLEHDDVCGTHICGLDLTAKVDHQILADDEHFLNFILFSGSK